MNATNQILTGYLRHIEERVRQTDEARGTLPLAEQRFVAQGEYRALCEVRDQLRQVIPYATGALPLTITLQIS